MAHGFLGLLVVHDAGYQNERQIKPSLLHKLQGAESIEIGEAVIAEDDVKVRVEMIEIVRLGFDSDPDGVEAGVTELTHNQDFIVPAVFD
jgi:hypothetical protein